MSELDDFKATYFEECAELISELEEQFAAIEGGDHSAERLHAVFRAVHSIKGGGGAFGFAALVGFTHAYETMLDRLREGQLALNGEVVALCLRANDVVADLITAARRSEPVPAELGAAERAQFERLTGGRTSDSGAAVLALEPAADERDREALDLDRFLDQPLPDEPGHWEIHFTPQSALYARANDPLLLFRELATLGELTVQAAVGDLPMLGEFDPFGAYCSWQITLTSNTASEGSIREVFEFVDGTCSLSVAQLVATAVRPTPPRRAPIVSQEQDHLPMTEAPAAPTVAKEAPAAPEPVAPAATGTPSAPAPTVGSIVVADRRSGLDDRRNAVSSIRVDLEKVDRVVNMVGELVIIQSMLTQELDDDTRARYQELVRGLEVLAQTTRGLQDAVMSIRAQPVKSVFSRMPRLVRELAQQTSKKLRLEMIGEGTEIDKTVIEQLADPLTHMIRNAVDHGIEAPGVRLALGKPDVGTIRLTAEQAGGSILVSVEDDGAGINRERVLQVAQRRGVVEAGQQLSDEQIDNLIFAPGFSTAEAVSDISGRGVGMDVVLSNIKKVGGFVQVRSAPGRGTRLTLRLPLTLAVLDVMLVAVGGCPYVIPLSSILETQLTEKADFPRGPSGSRMMRTRGDYVMAIDLAERFGLPQTADGQRFVVLCETEEGGERVAIIVDDIVGQQQVVIKSLEENFERIPGIAGGTILGDGSVALIVDVASLKTMPEQRRAA